MKQKALPIAAALFAVALMATNSAPASAAGLLAQTSNISNSIDNNVGKMAAGVEEVGYRKHRRGFRGSRRHHRRSYRHGRYIGGHYYGGRYYNNRRFNRHRGHVGRSGLSTQRDSRFYRGPGFNRGFGFRDGQK